MHFLIAFVGVVVVAAVLMFLTFSLYLFYVHEKYKHIPGPSRDSFYLGNLPYMSRRRKKDGCAYVEVVHEWFLQYGSLFVFWALHRPLIVVSDPHLAKRVCVQLRAGKSNRFYRSVAAPYGQRVFGKGLVSEVDFSIWQKKRVAVNPAFHRKYLMNLMDAFNDSCDSFVKKIGSLADGKTEVTMIDEFSRVTLDVIGKVAFSIEVDSIMNPNSEFPTAILECTKAMSNSTRFDYLLNYFYFLLPCHPYVASITKYAKFLRDFGEKVIRERLNVIKRGQKTPPDVLTHILNIAANDPSTTMEDIIDHFITFFIAGQETTSTQLAFTLYEILNNPEILLKISEEIDSVLGSRQHVSFEDLGKLHYLGQTLKESLRLHPPVCGVPKILDKDETVGGYLIPAGTDFDIIMYNIHHNADYWRDPEKFDPDRFSADIADVNHGVSFSSMFLPFSLGPRNCIGQTLAQVEAKVIMARLLQEYKLKLVPGQTLALMNAVTTRPKDGVVCTISKR